MTEINYSEDLAIDPHALDEEWLRQPVLYAQYSSLLSDAQKTRDYIKEKLEVKRSELDKDIRQNPEKYGVPKITESVVANTILSLDDYRKVGQEVIEATYEYNMLQNAINALEHKKRALENLVRLWLGSYFSGPIEPRDIPGGKRIIDIARDKISTKMRQEINTPKKIDSEGEQTSENQSPVRRRRI